MRCLSAVPRSRLTFCGLPARSVDQQTMEIVDAPHRLARKADDHVALLEASHRKRPHSPPQL